MRGLYVVVWGSALDDGLVDPVRISLSRLLSPEPVRTGIYTAGDSEITELMLESGESTAGPIRFVVIEDFELPAGPVRPPPVMPTLDALGRVEYTPALRDSIVREPTPGPVRIGGDGVRGGVRDRQETRCWGAAHRLRSPPEPRGREDWRDHGDSRRVKRGGASRAHQRSRRAGVNLSHSPHRG